MLVVVRTICDVKILSSDQIDESLQFAFTICFTILKVTFLLKNSVQDDDQIRKYHGRREWRPAAHGKACLEQEQDSCSQEV